MDITKLWDTTLAEIELQVSKANFTTWFKNTFIAKQEDGVIFLSVPNEFVKDWLSNKFHRTILKILREKNEFVRNLEYVVTKEGGVSKSDREHTHLIASHNELPLSEVYINKEDNLNPRYIFESFVVGPFNELAFAAAQAVIKKPGLVYNPLFVYGNTGHGKTHLIQAVGNYIKKANPHKKVFYLTSEKFVMDFVNALQNNKANLFKEKYRAYDLLIIDDIQFIAGKEKIQEEFFHLFNTFFDNNKQLIFSSDKHVNYIPDLEDRLKSRFNAGMIIEIPPPDKESRLAIIKTKVETLGVPIAFEIMDYLASAIDGNIRDLEGIVNTITMQTQLKHKDLSLLEIKNLIKTNIKPKKNISVKEVAKIVSDYYNIDESSVYEKTRRKEVVKPRQIIMYLLREDFNTSFPTIGEKLGGRDHTTVIHSCDKIKTDIKYDQSLVKELAEIRALF
jgi:chromosomal replication initiator protein